MTLTKVTEDKTVTADNVQAVAATQATLTLNLTDAVVTVNGTSYVNGQTVTVPVDTTLLWFPLELTPTRLLPLSLSAAKAIL